jgi:4-hydroxybenzoate polyprenyltransferase
MAMWALIVFLIGLSGLIFYLFNIFGWFAPWWGVIIMVMALGMLTRIWRKEKEAEKEKLVERIQELEAQLESQSK